MRSLVRAARSDDFAVLDDAAHVDDSRAVRRGGCVIHQYSGVSRPLEVRVVPPGSCVVRLHALQRVDEQGLALEVNRSFLGHDATLGLAPWPESMAHASPRVVEICSEKRLAVLSAHEARGRLLDGQVDNGIRIGHRLDGIGRAVSRQLNSAVLSVEVALVLAEFDILELGRAPQEVLLLVGVEDLGVELARCAYAATRKSAGALHTRKHLRGMSYATLLWMTWASARCPLSDMK